MTFLPQNYKIPASPSSYMKFDQGNNSFRILGSAIVGWEYFNTDNKPIRSKEPFEDTPSDIKKDGKVKAFWAFPVYNYQTKTVQILELTQKSIMTAIKALVDNPKWGDPKKYDISVTKSGEGLDTEYAVMGEPPIAEPTKEIKDAFAKKNINLDALFTGDDPFNSKEIVIGKDEMPD